MIDALNKYIDHTILKPEASEKDIEKLIEEAIEYNFKSICINPTWIEFARERLSNSDVKICTVIGFPLGANTKEAKLQEAQDALKKGAEELDMVLNIGFLKSKRYSEIEEELKEMAELAHKNDAILKLILETCLLTDEEIEKSCEMAEKCGVDFTKTSTGFSTAGAKVHHIEIMSKYKPQVKASGAIRDLKTAYEMINAGATRIGASASVNIIEEYKRESDSI